MLAGHRLLDRSRKPVVRDPQPELDIRVLGVVGEVSARQQNDLVVDDDELGVAHDGLPIGQLR